MSAQEAREAIEGWFSPGIRPAVSRALDDFETRLLREAAEKIRHERHSRYATGLEEEYWPADLIDPDKEESANGA